MAVIDTAFFYVRRITLELGDNVILFRFVLIYAMLAAGFTALVSFFTSIIKNSALASACKHAAVFLEVLSQAVAFCIVCTLLTYVSASSPLEYKDSSMLFLDRLFGFDWQSYTRWVNQSATVSNSFIYVYNSGLPLAFVAFIALTLTHEFAKLYCVILALVFSVALCCGLAAICPTTGVITYLHINTQQYPNLEHQLAMGWQQVREMEDLRKNEYHLMMFRNLSAMITFPSFHAANACILAWSCWTVKWLRWPVAVLNGFVILSTPVAGGHYLVDVVAGILIAAVVISFIASHFPNTERLASAP